MKLTNGVLTKITSADIDKNGHFHNDEVTAVADGIFYDLKNLKSVSLPNCTSIGNDCFLSNDALTSISLPALTTAGRYCFIYNDALTTISLPALTEAGNDCFRSNDALTTISLPALTTAGIYCFSNNDALTSITIKCQQLNVKNIDSYCYVISSKSNKKGYTIYTGGNFVFLSKKGLNLNPCFVAEKGGFTAHGETVKEAIIDVEFKLNSERIKSEPIYADTMVSISHYRTITGACEFGCKDWLESNGLKGITEIKASELVPLLRKTNAYNADRFMKLVQF